MVLFSGSGLGLDSARATVAVLRLHQGKQSRCYYICQEFRYVKLGSEIKLMHSCEIKLMFSLRIQPAEQESSQVMKLMPVKMVLPLLPPYAYQELREHS